MSSSKDGLSVSTLTGPNYLSWALKMHTYLQAKGLWFAIQAECPLPAADDQGTKAIEHWNDGNDQAMGHLILRMEGHIANKYFHMDTAQEIWNVLEAQYSKPSIASIYMEFKVMIDTNILFFPVDNSLFDPSWLVLVSFDQITPHNTILVLESNNQSFFVIDSKEKRFFYLEYSLEWDLLKGISHLLWADKSVNDRINEIDSLNHIIGLASNNLSNHSIFLNGKEFERLPTTMVSLL